MKKISIWAGSALGLAVAIVGAFGLVTEAQSGGRQFSLEISPVTLVGEVKPGVPKELDLTIKNNGQGTEFLKLGLIDFDVDPETGSVTPLDTEPQGVKDWVTFSEPRFRLESGKKIVQKVKVSLPKEAGFAYSFAITINRVSETDVDSGAGLAGRVLVFTLIGVDKPGATREFEVTEFKSDGFYEYLPAEFAVTFKNTGNSFVQPFGNIFIKQGDKQVAQLPVNNDRRYLLPDKKRTLYTTWESGFPSYKLVTDSETGISKRDLVWDWGKLGDFRIGQYTAKLVAVYNDGSRDIPVVLETSFWVFPWRIVLAVIAFLAIFIIGVASVWRRTSAVATRFGKRDKSKDSGKKSQNKKKTAKKKSSKT